MGSQSIIFNLKNMWELIVPKEGWEIKETPDILFLKSPAHIPNLNLAFLKTAQVDFLKASKFFEPNPYGMLCSQKQLVEGNPIAKAIIEITEMQLAVENNQHFEDISKIWVVQTQEELKEWSKTAGLIFGFDSHEMFKFIKELLYLEGSKLFYYKDNNQMLGVGQIFIDKTKLVYIASIGTLESHRRKGIGKLIMSACLKYGKELGGTKYALHASPAGEFLYKKLNFQEIEKCYFALF